MSKYYKCNLKVFILNLSTVLEEVHFVFYMSGSSSPAKYSGCLLPFISTYCKFCPTLPQATLQQEERESPDEGSDRPWISLVLSTGNCLPLLLLPSPSSSSSSSSSHPLHLFNGSKSVGCPVSSTSIHPAGASCSMKRPSSFN